MKLFLLTLLILILAPNTERVVGTYKIVNELSDDTLELNKNGTYVYKERGDSCWLWNDFGGKWYIDSNKLILIDKKKYEEETSTIKETENKKSRDKIIVKVTTTKNKPISNFYLKLESTDYKIEPQIKSTNNYGIVEFKKFDIVHNTSDKLALRYKYKVDKKEISDSSTVWGSSDSIYITINYKPKMIKETFKHEFKINGNELELIKSKLLIEGEKYIKL